MILHDPISHLMIMAWEIILQTLQAQLDNKDSINNTNNKRDKRKKNVPIDI